MAEDDLGQAKLIMRNLERAGISNPIVHVTDGEKALDYVYCRGEFEDREKTLPVMVLLDINMPKVDGIEVLKQIKSDPDISRLPVIMLTTTDDPREIGKCYELGCNVFLVKPIEHDAFVEALKRLGFFIQIVRVPNA